MTQAEKQDIIKLIKMFKPYDLQDEGNKRVAESVDEITNAIEGMVETKDWIKCSDMIPPIGENVLILCWDKTQLVATYSPNKRVFDVGSVYMISANLVTYWSYLPELPKEDEKQINHCEICGNGISDCEQICKKCETKYNIKWGDKISQKLHEYIVKIEKGVKE